MSNLFQVKDLHVEFSSTKKISGEKEKIYAVNGINLDIKEGEILAIAGESGCGKSTFSRSLMLLEKITSGDILFNGESIKTFTPEKMHNFRNRVQMIFQNPYASLNPKMKIYDILEEPLIINTKLKRAERKKIIEEKILQVGLETSVLEKYPHEFSGGQRQRITIARALVLNPSCLIADEPVSALDVSIQAQIINLLKDLKEKYNLTILFISHDLRVIQYLADRVAIMYLGEIVELADKNDLFRNPLHPYTQALLQAIPTFNENKKSQNILEGDLPTPRKILNNCKFCTRCPQVTDICNKNHPLLKSIDSTHFVRCFLK